MEWREATAQTNKAPDTIKMDLGQNILEKSLLIFSEAKASWVYTRFAQKKIPKSHRMPYAHSYPQNCIKKKLWWFSSSFLYLLHKNIYISFFSFLFIFLFLDAQNRFTFGVIMTSLWASKSVKQIDDAFSIFCDSPKGADASLSNWILISWL